MNERIKELAEQAEVTGYFAAGTTLATPIPLTPELENFAELIVRECAKILEIQGANTGREEYHYGAHLIEEHFGVKE